MAVPEQMRQLTMTEQRDVRWEEVPAPALEGDGQAIVRPLAVALCDLDQPILRGEAPIPGPLAIGHEFVAEVVDAGDDVASVAAGDRVVVPFQISDGECDNCRAGLTANCTGVRAQSMYGFGVIGGDWGGALSDLVRVPFADAMLLPAPAGVQSRDLASASDNIPDGWRTVAPGLERHPGGEVLIVAGGAPSIALYAVDVARALGAGAVRYVDTDPERLRLAAALGAETIEGPPEHRYDHHPITVDASADPEALRSALRSTAPGGICTSVGIYYEPVELPLLEVYVTGIDFHTSRVSARAALPAVLELIASGRISPGRVTSAVASWEDAPAAVAEPQTKLVIER